MNYVWVNYIWIALGAIAGASARYFLSLLIARDFPSAFPYGTLLINVSGSLLVGFFLVFSTERVLLDPRWRVLVVIGFCGSYNNVLQLRLRKLRAHGAGTMAIDWHQHRSQQRALPGRRPGWRGAWPRVVK